AELESDVRRIPLTRGRFAIVDAEDYARLSRYNWYAKGGPHTFYAVRRGMRNTEKRTVFMHRVITDAPGGLVVDHIDHNGINNCKSNLRVCTAAENNRNTRGRSDSKSRYKGVNWGNRDRKYSARICCNGKRITVGHFDDEVKAAKAYDKKAKELFGEFAYLNFPEEHG
ncbi:MAG: HNH endonuclease, partial [Planctomycetes bacterium]|nr:HNH endonuclease [Planctomycetota bacterium]